MSPRKDVYRKILPCSVCGKNVWIESDPEDCPGHYEPYKGKDGCKCGRPGRARLFDGLMTRNQRDKMLVKREQRRVRREAERRAREEGTPVSRLLAIASQMRALDSPEEQDAFDGYADDLESIARDLALKARGARK